MKILIDNGHGVETPGKRSPDGRFREYKYNRETARAVVEHLSHEVMMPNCSFPRKMTSPSKNEYAGPTGLPAR